jgi:biopolymer transport protein ExbD
MKFPRNARIFRGRLDAAPLASVFFLLAMFLLLAGLTYTPGVRLQLPLADDLPGLDRPTIPVAVDSSGRLYFENQLIDEAQLRLRLRQAVTNSAEPLALLVQADKAVTYEQLVRLSLLAREAGMREALLATLPRPVDTPAPVTP